MQIWKCAAAHSSYSFTHFRTSDARMHITNTFRKEQETRNRRRARWKVIVSIYTWRRKLVSITPTTCACGALGFKRILPASYIRILYKKCNSSFISPIPLGRLCMKLIRILWLNVGLLRFRLKFPSDILQDL